LIDKDDLLRYGNHALTYRIVERIFSQVGNCTLPLVLVLGDYVPVIWGLYLCLVRKTFLFVVPFLLQPQDGIDFAIEVDVHFVIKPFV
jgi:hypothetical protein